MKKIFAVLLTVICSISMAVALTACGADKHVHVFDKQVVSEDYLAAPATCTEKAKYYYSCECGEKSIATFEVGEPLGHTYSDNWESDDFYHWHNATCEHVNETTEKEIHAVSEWIIDTDATYERVGQRHKECTVCKKVLETEELPMLIKDEIVFKTLTVDENNNVYGKVPNSQATYSFLTEIIANGKATYVVSLDIYGMQQVPTKTVSINIGDNTFYITEMIGDEIKLYTVTIRRRPIYTVYIGNSTDPIYDRYYPYQRVEEDSLAPEPQLPQKAGYTFVGWDFDFTKAIVSDTYVNANWTANTDTKYTIEYYRQNIEDYNYTLYESVHLQGTTGTQVYAEQKNYEHFTLISGYGCESNLSGIIKGDGSFVLKLYYERNLYSLTNENIECGEITPSTPQKYGTLVTTEATEYLGCEFVGWYSGEELLSSDKIYIFNIDKDVTAKFKIKDEMLNFTFAASETTCEITGIKDENATQITIPNYVTSIGDSSFYNCSSLKSVVLGKSVTTIGEKAFFNCSELTSITLTDRITIIGDSAFSHSGLTSLTIPNNVASIGKYAFRLCGGLASVIISEGTTSIGEKVFYDCSELTNITIPNSVTSIGDYSFYNCRKLASITIPSSVTSIGISVFSGCSGLTSINIPNNVTNIGHMAFSECSGLINLTICNKNVKISSSAFYECSKIRNITYNGTVDEWKKNTEGMGWKEGFSEWCIVDCTDGIIRI